MRSSSSFRRQTSLVWPPSTWRMSKSVSSRRSASQGGTPRESPGKRWTRPGNSPLRRIHASGSRIACVYDVDAVIFERRAGRQRKKRAVAGVDADFQQALLEPRGAPHIAARRREGHGRGTVGVALLAVAVKDVSFQPFAGAPDDLVEATQPPAERFRENFVEGVAGESSNRELQTLGQACREGDCGRSFVSKAHAFVRRGRRQSPRGRLFAAVSQDSAPDLRLNARRTARALYQSAISASIRLLCRFLRRPFECLPPSLRLPKLSKPLLGLRVGLARLVSLRSPPDHGQTAGRSDKSRRSARAAGIGFTAVFPLRFNIFNALRPDLPPLITTQSRLRLGRRGQL